MRPTFPLFNTPLDLAHHFWKDLLEKQRSSSYTVIDATCGNGKDSLVLAKLIQGKDAKLLCIDLQKQAIDTTKKLLEENTPHALSYASFYQQSHTFIPSIPLSHPLLLVVFNLGYLPGGNKSLTTQVSSTLESIFSLLPILSLGGVISVTCYPGHEEGEKEEQALLKTFSSLDPLVWSFTSFFWKNRNNSPSLLLIQKKSSI